MYQKIFLNLLILPVFLNTELLAQEKILSDVKRSDIFKEEQKKNDSPIISKSKLPPSNGSLSTPVKLSDFRPSSCSKQEPLKNYPLSLQVQREKILPASPPLEHNQQVMT